ncbi:sensor histidine kinase [Eisenbergiella tayi]|uniref:sensor histidine kinase n=1 Tax=Eisenbergiella tayi TaxID=1432052 RepID=UPI0008491E32|nr:HAMP domain-containing sensor histidine kinase [Eisenbergiella tayi]ODR31902.1 hypothetical protein BEI60_29290 [Eisenbergiella tayi]
MIEALRRRFLMIAMLSLTGTLCVIGASINLGNLYRITRLADTAIELLYQNDGTFPLSDGERPDVAGGFQITEETPFETRYCIVHLTKKREVREVEMEHIAALDREKVVDLVSEIIRDGKKSGFNGYYRYQVYEKGEESTIVVLNCFLQLQSVYNVLQVTLLVIVCCVTLVFFLLLLLSGRVIRPFAENIERQKRFLTDVSHELKTPLGIISANTGVLELTKGKDEWTESIRNQVKRLDSLIKDLIELSKSEEYVKESEFTEFSVSQIAEANADSFRTLAQMQGKQLNAEIEPGVCMRGQEDSIIRLMTILLDNGVKYCDPSGTVVLRLRQKGRQVVLQVANPCRDMDTAQVPHLFDRFYRADSSRSRQSGGYGIGLSIARAVTEGHKGRIGAAYEAGNLVFTVVLPGIAGKNIQL